MRRRDFIAALCGTVAMPVVARTQERVRRIGVLLAGNEDDPENKTRLKVMRDVLRRLGWVDGRNIQIEVRQGGGTNPAHMRAQAAELVALNPDVLFAAPSSGFAAMRSSTSTLPIIFAQVTDPVGQGYVASLARPGGNASGFSQYEFAIAVKWLELLKQLAPDVSRVAVLFHQTSPLVQGFLRPLEADAAKFGLQLTRAPANDAADISRVVEGFARNPSGGMIVLPAALTAAHRNLIFTLADRHRLPAVYPFGYYARDGGLASYGVDNIDLYRRAAGYIDRVLKGEKPAELPVQQADKFELVSNLRTAKALGLEVPITLLARTDEVIE
jgi:putative ABC transport system substrate-binding protein